jgi:hypothetical protein
LSLRLFRSPCLLKYAPEYAATAEPMTVKTLGSRRPQVQLPTHSFSQAINVKSSGLFSKPSFCQ